MKALNCSSSSLRISSFPSSMLRDYAVLPDSHRHLVGGFPPTSASGLVDLSLRSPSHFKLTAPIGWAVLGFFFPHWKGLICRIPLVCELQQNNPWHTLTCQSTLRPLSAQLLHWNEAEKTWPTLFPCVWKPFVLIMCTSDCRASQKKRIFLYLKQLKHFTVV